MREVSHNEFYSQLAKWLENEKIRSAKCHHMLNRTLCQFWESVKVDDLSIPVDQGSGQSGSARVPHGLSHRNDGRRNETHRTNCK